MSTEIIIFMKKIMAIKNHLWLVILIGFTFISCERSETELPPPDDKVLYKKVECFITPAVGGNLISSKKFFWGSYEYDDSGNVIESKNRVNTLTDTLLNGLMLYQKKYNGKTLIESTESCSDFYKEVTKCNGNTVLEVYRYDKQGLLTHIVNEFESDKWTKSFEFGVINNQEYLFETTIFGSPGGVTQVISNPDLDPHIRYLYINREASFRTPHEIYPNPVNELRTRVFVNQEYNQDKTIKYEDMYFVDKDNKLEELIGKLEYSYYK